MKTLHDKLTKLRSEIEALSGERNTIESAPIPRGEVEAQIAAAIDAPWSDQIMSPEPAGLLHGGFNGAELQHMLSRPALLVAVIPDAIKAYVIGLYDRDLGDAEPGLGALERRRRLAEIDAQVFELETQEETVCEQLEAAGADVQRRVGADPAAQLGLDDVRDTAA